MHTIAQYMRGVLRELLLVFLLVSSGCTGPIFLEPEDGSPSWAPDSSRIAFVCYRRERAALSYNQEYQGPYNGIEGYNLREICTSNADGSDRQQLTDNTAVDLDPSWSPDGMQIAFVSNRDTLTTGGTNIYIMQSNGANPVNLTHYAAGYFRPRWSPDGNTIAFVATRDNVEFGLYIMSIHDGEIRRLTSRERVLDFDWSPNGKLIAFSSLLPSNTGEIYIVDVETGVETRLTENNENDYEPVWGSDGQQIAFASVRDDGAHVYVMDVQARRIAEVSEGPASKGGGVSWSPNGRFLSYVSEDQKVERSLNVLDTENGARRVFEHFAGVYEQSLWGITSAPLWSPDSNYLVYTSSEDWNSDGWPETKIRILQVESGQDWTISRQR